MNPKPDETRTNVNTLYLLNAPICHTPGLRYVTRTIDRATAQRMVRAVNTTGPYDTVTSAIGHDGTAQVLSLVLDDKVPVNRISMQYLAGDAAIALQLRRRQPEGVVLTAEMVEEIGYDLTLIETSPAPVCVVYGSAAVAAARLTIEPRADLLPRDIDVTYGGMDRHEAAQCVRAWAKEVGLGTFLALDHHPELTEYRGASLRTPDEEIAAHYSVRLPYPSNVAQPPFVVLAGVPVVSHTPVSNLASLMRGLGPDADELEAGKALAGWVANNRDGLRITMTSGHRGADDTYKEGTLDGLRKGWSKLAPLDMKRGLAILEHVNGYVAGLGDLLEVLFYQPIAGRIIGQIADESNDMHTGEATPWGEMVVRRKHGPVYEVRVGLRSMTFSEAAAWLSSPRQAT